MIFEYIRDHRYLGSLKWLCGMLGVSRSGYYAWLNRDFSVRERRNAELLAEIRAVHRQFKGRYGRPRITDELKDQGIDCGYNRVGRLMQQDGLYGKPRRRRRQSTTNSDHKGLIYPNVLNQQFNVSTPNTVWVSDITYIPTQDGWLYLCIVLDLFSRKVVGWSLQASLSSTLTVQALKMATGQRCPPKGLVFHSDRGIQYANAQFQAHLSRAGFTQSMSRTGNCYDNAVAESFFGSLKTEEVNDHTYHTHEEAKNAVFEYIEGYNRSRRHSHNQNQSPDQFEKTRFT